MQCTQQIYVQTHKLCNCIQVHIPIYPVGASRAVMLWAEHQSRNIPQGLYVVLLWIGDVSMTRVASHLAILPGVQCYSGLQCPALSDVCTVDPHLSEHLGTKGWLDMRNVQITETGLNTL